MVKKAEELDIGQHIIMAFSEESSGGRNNPNNLENVMEAIIGAIYVDGGFSEVSKVVRAIWGEIIPEDSLLQIQRVHCKNCFKIEECLYHYMKWLIRGGEIHAPTYKVKVSAGQDIEYGYGGNIKSAEKRCCY
jgi:ribonuclease-3